jgi:hypothetical protein
MKLLDVCARAFFVNGFTDERKSMSLSPWSGFGKQSPLVRLT